MDYKFDASVVKYIPKKYQKFLLEVYRGDDSIWGTLKDEYITSTTESYIIHEYSIKDFVFAVTHTIEEEQFHRRIQNGTDRKWFLG